MDHLAGVPLYHVPKGVLVPILNLTLLLVYVSSPGQEMLDRVRSQPLTTADLNALPYCQQISRTLGFCSQSSGGTTLN